MTPESLERLLCSTFCGAIGVRAVPSGLAVASAFKDGSGDPMTFYVNSTEDGFVIEDDGSYLSHLQAMDIPFETGQRGQLLDAILQQGGAFWDRESFEIKTTAFGAELLGEKAIGFLSALIRIRDLELLTREVVRSTFRDDALEAIRRTFEPVAVIDEDAPVDVDLSEFPADVVIRPKAAGAVPTALYLVHSNDKLNEALLLQIETQMLDRKDVRVVALLEDADMKLISRKRFQRAQNRSLLMPIFRGDEDAAMRMIAERAGYPRTATGALH